MSWLLPVVAETHDGWLSDAKTFPVTDEHAFAALDGAASGPIAEGNVGGGTGMICHEFKGGTGTASRIVELPAGSCTVGALVQANYGARELLRVDGVPVGREIDFGQVPSARNAGSIIVVLATDAPLLPIQCQRLARRAATGRDRPGIGHASMLGTGWSAVVSAVWRSASGLVRATRTSGIVRAGGG